MVNHSIREELVALICVDFIRIAVLSGLLTAIDRAGLISRLQLFSHLENGMSVQRSRTPMLTFLLGVVVTGLTTFSASAVAQTNRPSAYDPLNAFVGTWTAKRPGETTPFLVLKLHESDSKLTGTMNHFKLAVIGNGTIVGNPGIGESPVTELSVSNGDLWFVWSEPPLAGDKAKFVLGGTKRGFLVILVPAEQAQRIVADNPRASGFNPVIYVSREEGTDTDNEKRTEGSPEKWQVGNMAGLINTAEAQYKFAHGVYADYATLLRSGQLKDTGGREFTLLPRNFQSETDPLPGYRLRVLISQDGNSYQLSIQETTTDCGTGLFSDETGVVFEGHALDGRQSRCDTDQQEN
jgi:hypothetical protein